MTCIVALRQDGKIYIGADSCGSNSYDYTVREDKKVFKKGNMIFGFTSSFRMGQILQYKLIIPEHPLGMSDIEYMSSCFIDEVRKCLRDNGFAEKDKEVERGGVFLVGYKNNIYKIESDYQVGIRRGNYNTTGNGEDVSLGVMFATEKSTMNPEDRIRLALKASANFKVGVCSPFYIEVL